MCVHGLIPEIRLRGRRISYCEATRQTWEQTPHQELCLSSEYQALKWPPVPKHA